jgi:hypothetical protein
MPGRTHFLVRVAPVTACGSHLIGKETERGWERVEDVSTLMPSFVQYRHVKRLRHKRFESAYRKSLLMTWRRKRD